MAEFDPNKFERDMALLPVHVTAAIAVRAAMRVLPTLTTTGSIEARAFWYWPDNERPVHALAEHWDPKKHITVPNPDYGCKDKWAVAPADKEITVYHSNALRIEKAGLAKAYHNESEPWDERTDLTVIGPSTISV
ncbi:MAG TPA: hypothetical protein VE422_13275 [Terriglobia bacterium]|nr:hypothetical protein [Terriglobia bacterium]